MKWKEALPGLLSAQGRAVLPLAREQTGERKPALLLLDACCFCERTDVPLVQNVQGADYAL